MEQDFHFLQYPEFSGYPHDQKQEVEVEVLRKRRQTKENLRDIAERFNKRPMKPDWLLRALELGCIEKGAVEGAESNAIKTIEGGEEEEEKGETELVKDRTATGDSALKWNPADFREGQDAAMALTSPRAVALRACML